MSKSFGKIAVIGLALVGATLFIVVTSRQPGSHEQSPAAKEATPQSPGFGSKVPRDRKQQTEKLPSVTGEELTRHLMALARSGQSLKVLEIMEGIPPADRQQIDIILVAEVCSAADFERTWAFIKGSELGESEESEVLASACSSVALRDASGFELVRKKLNELTASGHGDTRLLKQLFVSKAIPWSSAVTYALDYKDPELRSAAVRGLASRLMVSAEQPGWDSGFLAQFSSNDRATLVEALGTRVKLAGRAERAGELGKTLDALMESQASNSREVVGPFLKGASNAAPEEAWLRWTETEKFGGNQTPANSEVTVALLDNLAKQSYRLAIDSLGAAEGMESSERERETGRLLSTWLESNKATDAIAWWNEAKASGVAGQRPIVAETVFKHFLSKGKAEEAESVLGEIKDQAVSDRLRSELEAAQAAANGK